MKVLVALDGSTHSQQIPHNLMALAPIDDMILFHAYTVPELAYPGMGMSVGHDFFVRMEKELTQEGKRVIEDVETQLPKDIGQVHHCMKQGATAESILDTAEEEQVDLIVLGSRGLGIIQEHALGSVSHHVVTHARCSTLLAKNKHNSFHDILVPIKNETDGEHTLSFLNTCPIRGSLKLTLLHVIPFAQPSMPVGAFIPDSIRKQLVEHGQMLMNSLATRLAPLGYITTTLVKTGAPSIVIHEEAQRLQAGLILMRQRTENTLNRVLLGSVSHSVTHHSTCSVMLAH